MSDYKITIKNVDECPLSLELDDNRYACDWMEDGFCVGLGQPGCPFQPMPSCETCALKNLGCIRKAMHEGGEDFMSDEQLTHCSAYTPEVK